MDNETPADDSTDQVVTPQSIDANEAQPGLPGLEVSPYMPTPEMLSKEQTEEDPED